MARTRSKPTKPSPKETTPEPPASTAKPLPPSTSNPPKLFVLPKDASKDALIITLNNPSNNTLSRYYFCPNNGFYEFTRIAAPRKDFKSWLITAEHGNSTTNANEEEQGEKQGMRIGSGYVTKTADLFLATPIDILFLILPALAPKNSKDTKQHFLALEDYMDMLSSSSPHWKALVPQFPTLGPMVEKAIRQVCDTVTAGDETMYRLSTQKLVDILFKKAERMVRKGLPSSMEERFVTSVLQVPVLNVRRGEESTLCGPSTTTSTPGAATEKPTQTTSSSKPQQTTPPTTTIPHLLRLRTSFTYLTNTYLPPTLPPHLHPLTTPTFHPLTTHLTALAALKAEAASQRALSDNMSRKHALQEDDEELERRAEKRRKKEEEERKKKMEGRNVKMLKKVDVSGMKKMSCFFRPVGREGG
ncbi:hypothetical protein BDW02DRAFT_560769 [Decorospora gaudefroyi]|uniref:Ribonuclease H2 subunit B n=1 Tax=Decorospora gaudefroyi TaxID=184978 RepID=A0A6A5K4G4_9PLEO|nr:hypothetical protein BDW02DRAFT_560769 [Decorospora gaudefroyi]